MSFFIAAAVIGTALYTADAQRKTGKAQQYELEKQADEEKTAAEGRELSRRQQLNKVLSQSILGQTDSGIGSEGTPQSIALSNAKTASVSEGLEGLSDKLKQAQLRRQGKMARDTSKVAAASTMLNATVSAGQLS